MNKNILYVIGALIIVAVVFFLLNAYGPQNTQKEPVAAPSYKDATYIIDGKSITLADGFSEIETAPGSASKITTRYFGNVVMLDFDEDGREDIAFLLTQETGGSGTFFYVVAALNKEVGYIGSQALFLGDRIAPQTTEVSQNPSHKNVIVVNYAERKPGEPMTAQPSVGKSIWIKLDPQTMQFGEVVQNFEGEADPSRMTLGMKTWNFIRAEDAKAPIAFKRPGAFALAFGKDGRFSATTDCNSVSGTYTADKNTVSFGNMASTKMYCEGSDESIFVSFLGNTTGYIFTSRGELVLQLKSGGSVTFR